MRRVVVGLLILATVTIFGQRGDRNPEDTYLKGIKVEETKPKQNLTGIEQAQLYADQICELGKQLKDDLVKKGGQKKFVTNPELVQNDADIQRILKELDGKAKAIGKLAK